MKITLSRLGASLRAIISRLAEWKSRLPLSPAESSVAMFVVCALAGSVAWRVWTMIATPAVRPMPAEFAALDSVFAARSAAPHLEYTARDTHSVLWSASLSVRKSTPAPNSIDLNRATAPELQRLPGVGPSLAARIIAFRRITPFRRIDDILRVEGIGQRKWERMRPFLMVE